MRSKANNQYVSDLNQVIVRVLPKHTLAGYTNDTVYTQQWDMSATSLCAKASNAYLTTQRTCHWLTKQVLNARYGYLYNAKLHQLYGRGGDGKCPVCRHCRAGGPVDDSVGHILGGCAHPTMKGMYINRHNAAVRTITETIHNGKRGGGYLIMDAGRQEDLPPYCAGQRLPTWMLPDDPDTSEIDKMRPDILFIPELPLCSTRGTKSRPYKGPADKSKCNIYIIEVGYTGDLNHSEKKERKAEQHRQLADKLQRAGWKVHYTDAEIVTLGTTGTVPNTLKPLLTKLGATPGDADGCCTKLHKHAVNSMGSIIQCRRKMGGNTHQTPGG